MNLPIQTGEQLQGLCPREVLQKKNLGSVLSYINPWVVVKVNLLHMLGFLSASTVFMTVLGPGRFGHH